MAILFITHKSIIYEIGLKYPEYLPCLNRLKSFFYFDIEIIITNLLSAT